MSFRPYLIDYLAQATKTASAEIDRLLATPPDSKLGDYALPCFSFGKNPKEAAQYLKKSLVLPDFIEKIAVVGPYLNFFINKSLLAKETLEQIQQKKELYGHGQAAKTIVIEYCGPNTNKPLHIGHLRNMALGNALCRLLHFQGNTVSPVNIINDRGIHICKSMLAYQKFGDNQEPTKKGDHFVGDYYVKFAQEEKEDPTLMHQAQEMLYAWEQNDPKIRALWKKMNSWVLAGFKETYKRFGVAFDKEYYESELYLQGKDIAFAGLKNEIFIKNDDKAIVAPLEKFDLPDKVILRGDGTSVYITQDLYLALQRYEDFLFDQAIYVVASEQRLHFKQLFAILKMLGHKLNLTHYSYGLVHLPSGRMKSREGTVVDADDLMDDVAVLALKEIQLRHKTIDVQAAQSRADAIALAALKFHMLKTDAIRDIVFHPEESLRFDGETGPYIQYVHARACSILRKQAAPKTADCTLLSHEKEAALVSLLGKFPLMIDLAASQQRIHLVCRYLLDLAQAFNEFYHSCQVISDDTKLTAARLYLVDSVRQVIANGLAVLGIEALEEM